MKQDMTVVRYQEACGALSRVTSALEAKKISDISRAAEVYAVRQGDKELRERAHRTHIQALRIEGEFLEVEAKAKAGRPKKNQLPEQPISAETLKQKGISHTESVEAQAVAAVAKDEPEVFAELEAGKTSVKKVVKKRRRKKQAGALAAAAAVVSKARVEEVCDVRCCDFKELLAAVKPDCIITDPPYPEEFIPIYYDFAEASWSVPLVAVMCGQTYLPRILADMTKCLKYRWTLAYLTPGGQAVQQWDRKVNVAWKPVLLFGKAVDWIGDVCRSDVNDNDKSHHAWGQSESGMTDLVKRLAKPGQLVCDPFCGGGATAVAALACGCRFVGCDIDGECVKRTLQRAAAFIGRAGK